MRNEYEDYKDKNSDPCNYSSCLKATRDGFANGIMGKTGKQIKITSIFPVHPNPLWHQISQEWFNIEYKFKQGMHVQLTCVNVG